MNCARKRQEGIFFATVSFSNKVTSGLGSVVAGFALTLIAWPAGAEIRTAADVPADTWFGWVCYTGQLCRALP